MCGKQIAFTLSTLPLPLSSLSQVMMMVGIKPVPDALGRVNKLEVMTLEELGRPRIDVVVNCSGVFRDLFVNQVRGRAHTHSPHVCPKHMQQPAKPSSPIAEGAQD